MKKSIINYSNETVVRTKNKRITVKSTDGVTIVRFDSADINANTPSVGHACSKGKIRHTLIKLSDDSMALMIKAYLCRKEYDTTVSKP